MINGDILECENDGVVLRVDDAAQNKCPMCHKGSYKILAEYVDLNVAFQRIGSALKSSDPLGFKLLIEEIKSSEKSE